MEEGIIPEKGKGVEGGCMAILLELRGRGPFHKFRCFKVGNVVLLEEGVDGLCCCASRAGLGH